MMRLALFACLLAVPLAAAQDMPPDMSDPSNASTDPAAEGPDQSIEGAAGVSWGAVALLAGAALAGVLAWSLVKQDRGE